MPGLALVAIGIGVVFLWLASASAHFWTKLIHAQNIDKLGQWGDSFGGLNALFAAFGFIAVVATLRLQQRQNADARADQHRQSFDSTFFHLLGLLRETRDAVLFENSADYAAAHPRDDRADAEQHGLAAFQAAWREMDYRLLPTPDATVNRINDVYQRHIHQEYEGNFGPYFRLIYTMLRRVKMDTVLTEREKASYGNILRSQLNSYELTMLGVNALSISISKDMKELITEFHFLKYVPYEGGRRRMLERVYDPSSFAGRPDEAET